MLNIYLIKDSDLLKNHIEGLMILGLTDNFYMNLLFFIPWIFFMALGYNFIKYVPFVKRKENINFFRVVYGFLIILIFIFVWINLFETYGSDVGAAWSMLIFLDLPIIFGILAILVKNRLFIYLSLFAFIFSDLVMYYKNEFEDLLYIILFAALVLLFIEIAESALKFSSVYSNLNTERDRSDYDLLKNTVLKYFIGLISVVGLTVIFAYMIFNSQVIFLMIMPDEIVNSLEFKSPVFLFIPLILFAIFLFFIKWILKYGSSLKILFPASRQGSKKGTIKNE
jgi:hypothetical protein